MPQYTQSANDNFLKEHGGFDLPWRMLIFTSSIFLIAIVIYLGLIFGYKPYLVSSIGKTESELNSLVLQIEAESQQDFVEFYSQVVNLKNLLNSHVTTSQFMPLLETVTHQKVVYSSLILITKERSLRAEGFAETYDVLSAQLALYEQANWIERVILDNSSQADDFVKFGVRIIIKDETFNL